MPNNVKSCKKNDEKAQTAKFTVLQGEVSSTVLKHGKLGKLKRELLKIFKYYTKSRVPPCERARPQLSKNVVLFVCTTF